MANTPPPLIRSSKAFSVEIPEGSNSAKARRSDIVANDELDIHHKTSQFHDSLTDLQAASDMHTPADARSELVFAETSLNPSDQFHHEADTKTSEDRFVVDNTKSNADRIVAIEDKGLSDHLAHLPDQANNVGDNLHALPDDSFKDRFAHDESNKAFKDRMAGETQTPLNDHLVSAGARALNSNELGIDQDAFKDHLQLLPEDSANLQTPTGMTRDSIKDRLADAGEETAPHNRQGLPDDSIHNDRTAFAHATDPANNTQALPDEHLKDSAQSLAKQALHDNLQSLDQHSLKDNRQGIDDKALQQRSATLPADESTTAAQSFKAAQRLTDNHASLANEAVHSRHDELEKSPIKDHIEALADTHQALNPGPSPAKKEASAPSDAAPVHTAADHRTAPAHTGLSTPSDISKAEHAKRLEEFHGRVEAIRKSVSGINHLLDDLQDKH